MKVSVIVNILILLVLVTILGITLYVIINMDKVLNNTLKVGLSVIDKNEKSIQSRLDKFSKTTITNVMKDKNIVSQATDTTANILDSDQVNKSLVNQSNNILKNPTVRTNTANMISSEPVSGSIADVVKNAVSPLIYPYDRYNGVIVR
jgi:hypothetical protein